MPEPPQTLESLRADFLNTGDASPVLAGRTELVDQILRSAYDETLGIHFPTELAVLAVGGYGRGELFPYSDVDVLLLAQSEATARSLGDPLSDFLRTLWDSGLRLSHSVRTVAECCEVNEENIELNISLLDARFLLGERGRYDELNGRLPKFLHSRGQNLAGHLCRMTRSRHDQYNRTIYHLEPNIKETPGGMRDIHLVHWFSKLRGAQEVEEFVELVDARRFLETLRCWLHYRSGRDNNLLDFEAQESIASQPFSPAHDPATWMREYFRNAREIFRLATRNLEIAEERTSSLLNQFRDWRSRLSNAEFTVSRERVYLRAPQQLAGDPDWVFRLFEFVARHGVRPARESESRLAESLSKFAEYYRSSDKLWRSMAELLAQPHSALALRAMHDTGVLRAFFPEWGRMESLVVRDFYHRYTVDEHTLVTLETLEELGSGKLNNGGKERFAGVLSEIGQPAVLRFALLFHDVGKGGGRGEHAAASLEVADTVMERIHTPAEERETIRFLIGHHLDLSAVMHARDLNDPATAQYLADRIQTLERLKLLTLLTYADISAVNPAAMTPWRREQLWHVYVLAHRHFTKELAGERIHVPEDDPTATFLEGFPIRYLRTHSEAEIRAHMELEQISKQKSVAVDLSKHSGVHRLTVVARDRPYLFASIAGALASFGMNILKAEAFANVNGVVLDTFSFADPLRTLELNPSELDHLRHTIERTVLGKVDVNQLLKKRPPPSRPVSRAGIQPTVSFENEASETATLVQFFGEDRPGLLFDLARVLSSAGCNIEVVLIDTEAHRALDVFYVTADGEKLSPELQATLKQAMLEASHP